MNTATAEILVLSALLCACAGHKHSQSDQNAQAMQAVRNEVSRVVPDASRREKIHATVDRYEDELRTFDRYVSEFKDRLQVLNSNPDVSRAQFTDQIAQYEGERKATRARLVQIHHELLALTTDSEWRSIAKREIEVLRLADPGRARQEAK